MEGSGLQWPLACDGEICCVASVPPVGVITGGGPAITVRGGTRGSRPASGRRRQRVPSQRKGPGSQAGAAQGRGARGSVLPRAQRDVWGCRAPTRDRSVSVSRCCRSRWEAAPLALTLGHAGPSSCGEETSERRPSPPRPRGREGEPLSAAGTRGHTDPLPTALTRPRPGPAASRPTPLRMTRPRPPFGSHTRREEPDSELEHSVPDWPLFTYSGF